MFSLSLLSPRVIFILCSFLDFGLTILFRIKFTFYSYYSEPILSCSPIYRYPLFSLLKLALFWHKILTSCSWLTALFMWRSPQPHFTEDETFSRSTTTCISNNGRFRQLFGVVYCLRLRDDTKMTKLWFRTSHPNLFETMLLTQRRRSDQHAVTRPLHLGSS